MKMKEVILGIERQDDQFSMNGSRAMPFVIAFIYPATGENICIKGSSHLVHAYIKEHYDSVPYIAHWTYWKRGCYSVSIHIQGKALYLGKKHHRESCVSYIYNPPNRHQKWVLYAAVKNEYVPLATYRKPPRGWITLLNQFLPKVA